MIRTAWLAVGLGIAASTGASPPVEAPKPPAAATVSGCAECRFLPVPRPRGPIVPVQDGPQFAGPEQTPERLPVPTDATPLPPAEADPGLRDLVEQFLPDVTPEERGVWMEELRGLPPEIARDLLAARSRFGEPGPLPDAGLVPPPQTEPVTPESEFAPLRSGPPATESSPLGVTATVAMLKRAEAILVHNIANAETIAYKRLQPLTTDAAGTGGVGGLSVRRIERQGTLAETGRTYDLAIDGPGFFQVRHGDTVALTRRGTFQAGGDGELVLEVEGQEWALHPPVQVPPEMAELSVDEAGVVSCRLPGGAVLGVGRIELARVADGSGLESAGGGLFAVPESAGPVAVGLPGEEGFGTVRQGCLERSNVDLGEELRALRRTRRQIAALQELATPQLAMPVTDETVR